MTADAIEIQSFKVALDRAFYASVAGPLGEGLKKSPTALVPHLALVTEV